MDDITREDLDLMASAVNYRNWIFSKIEPHLGDPVLEVGGGIGNYTDLLASRARVVSIEPHAECAAILRGKYADSEQVSVENVDLMAYPPQPSSFRTVVCLNVLEHIEDDQAAVRKMASMLTPGGRLVLLVPAVRWLYGPIDRALLHNRRYAMREIRSLIDSTGLRRLRIEYMNLAGFFGWLVNARILQRARQSRGQVRFFDRVVVPVMRRLESALPPPVGQSLFVVAENPG